MSRATPALAALGLLAELALFRVAPEASPAITLPFHALIALLAVLLAARSAAGRRALAVLLLLAAAGLGLIEIGTRVTAPHAAPDDASWRAAVEKRADAVRAAVEAVLAEERATVLALPPEIFSPSASRQELFVRLDAIERDRARSRAGSGLTIYDAEGQALAWAGDTSICREALEVGASPARPAQFVQKSALRTSVVTLRQGGGDGPRRTLAAELLLEAPSDPGAWRRLIERPIAPGADVRAEFLEPGEADSALQEFLALGGQRYWKRGGGGSSQMIAPVRSSSGEILGLLTFAPDPPQAAAARAIRRAELGRQALLVVAILTALFLGFALARRTLALAELVALALLLVALRLALGSLAAIVPGPAIFDYRLFSAPIPLGLAASPADCFLTALTIFGLAGIGAIGIRRSGRAASVAGVIASAVIAAALAGLTKAWVTDSSLNPEHVPVLPPELPHLAIGWGHAALALSAAILVLASLAKRGGALSARAVAAALVAAGAASHLMLVSEAAKVPRALIETALAPEVLRARSSAHERLADVLADADSDPRWRAALGASRGSRDVLAFEGWRESDLGRTGARSALAVTDMAGEIISSFAYGLPESVIADTTPSEPPPPGRLPPGGAVVSEASLEVLSLRVPLLRGEKLLYRGGAPVGRLVAILSAEIDNLPFLTRGDPLLRALGAQGAELIYDEYFGGAPLFVAYSPAGEVIAPSAEQVAPLEATLVHLRVPTWTTTRCGGTDYRTYLFPTDEGPRAIGYAAPSRIAMIAGLLRSCLLLVPVLVPILFLGALLTAPDLRTGLSLIRWTLLSPGLTLKPRTRAAWAG